MRIQDFAQGMFVTSAVFNDEAVELTFIDDRKQTPNVMEIDTMVFPVTQDPDRLNICSQIQALLQDLIIRVHSDRRDEINGLEKTNQAPSSREAIAKMMAEQMESAQSQKDEATE